MHLRLFLLSGLLFLTPALVRAQSHVPPPANANAIDVVKFVVNYEDHATDSTALLRGGGDKPTKLETLLFTHAFLTDWYATKAEETANPDPGNITNGDTDYIVGDGPEGQEPQSVKFNDISNVPNGTMISMTYRTNGSYSSLFFLKNENGRFKVDDILLEPLADKNFDPNTPHNAGTSEGLRKDIETASTK